MTRRNDLTCAVLVVLMLVGAFSAGGCAAVVRPDHPRMLFSAGDLPWIRERCQTTHKEIWQELKNWMDGSLDYEPDDRPQSAVVPRTLGFVYQVTGDEKYARAGIRLLRHYAKLHLGKVRGGQDANIWPAVDLRRHNYIAYDWLYNGMTPEERAEIGNMLLEITELHAKQDTWDHGYVGGYGQHEDAFYCGLALYESGVNDAKAEEFLKSGFDFLLNQTVAGRNQVATDDGGIQSGMGYATYNYIPVEAYFLSLWKSATGEDLFDRDSSLRYFPVWALYTITPSFETPPICDIGAVDDARVSANSLRLFLSLIASRYKDGRAAWLVPGPGRYWINNGAEYILWSDPSINPDLLGPELPHGRHFEGLGWVAMRTGWDPDSTYSIFVGGDYYAGHKHRDINSFVIYKKGYLAADARRRIYQTAGHNTLLVFTDDNDGEQRRPKGDLMYRNVPEVVPECDMGDIVAFETSPHYVYVCGDGTKAYNWRGEGEYVYGREQTVYRPQLESFTRQYVYLMPNTFVVYDRTVSVKPDARKVWQLQTWNEPKIDTGSGTIVAEHGEGRLTSVTLLPEKPVIKAQPQHLVGAEQTKADLWQTTVERDAPAKDEQFLHVIHVGDAAGYKRPEVERIDGDGTVGAAITADGMTYTVTFNTVGPVGGHVTISKQVAAGGPAAAMHEADSALAKLEQAVGAGGLEATRSAAEDLRRALNGLVRTISQVLIDKDLTTTVQPQKGYAEAK